MTSEPDEKMLAEILYEAMVGFTYGEQACIPNSKSVTSVFKGAGCMQQNDLPDRTKVVPLLRRPASLMKDSYEQPF
jgi:hypothetical protein